MIISHPLSGRKPSDLDMEESEDIDEDYILWETSSALGFSSIRVGCLITRLKNSDYLERQMGR